VRPALCTISFRHHLVSLTQIAHFAAKHGFSGIELWGAHAQNLVESPEGDPALLTHLGLSVPMVSDYLPLRGDRQVALRKARRLCSLVRHWGAKKLRTFAGDLGSAEVTAELRRDWISRMRELCQLTDDYGVQLVVETHPNTLADTPASTLQLLAEVDHPALRINFDVIHVWEAQAEPIEVFRLMEPFISHMHLKNIIDRTALGVFAPANVYAPAGDRTGMVELFGGAFDFGHFLRGVRSDFPLSWRSLDASLEWFGPNVHSTLEHDSKQLVWLETESTERTRSSGEAMRARAASSR
jgi:3-dehydroshikimate dehydratase